MHSAASASVLPATCAARKASRFFKIASSSAPAKAGTAASMGSANADSASSRRVTVIVSSLGFLLSPVSLAVVHGFVEDRFRPHRNSLVNPLCALTARAKPLPWRSFKGLAAHARTVASPDRNPQSRPRLRPRAGGRPCAALRGLGADHPQGPQRSLRAARADPHPWRRDDRLRRGKPRL